MAATIRFIASDFGGPVEVSAVHGNRTGGASTGTEIIRTEPGASGGVFEGAEVYLVGTASAPPTTLNFWQHDASAGSYTLVGYLKWSQEINPNSNQSEIFIGVMRPFGGPVYLANADNIRAAAMSGSATYSIRPLGGVY